MVSQNQVSKYAMRNLVHLQNSLIVKKKNGSQKVFADYTALEKSQFTILKDSLFLWSLGFVEHRYRGFRWWVDPHQCNLK